MNTRSAGVAPRLCTARTEADGPFARSEGTEPVNLDRPRLRSALKRLRRIQFDRSEPIDVAMAAQEMLDFLAMLAGLKPVCLLGRGFDPPGWASGVERLAREVGLHVLLGPKWYAEPKHAGLPDWFPETAPIDAVDAPAMYVCKSGHLARQVSAIWAGGAPTVEQEARLLGYPHCCVRDHYRRARMHHDAFSLMLSRIANGDQDEMRRLVREEVDLTAETDQEKALLMEACTVRAAPYTSILMCGSCAVDANGPAMRLSRQYEHLARATDPLLPSEIEVFQDALTAYQGSR